MYLHYPDLIWESPDELARLERQHRGSPVADRLQMLRLLKSGAYRSRRALAEVLGYSERQLHRWFETYRSSGLDGLLAHQRPGGSQERISAEAFAALEAEMTAGRIATLKDAQRYLHEQHGICFRDWWSQRSVSPPEGQAQDGPTPPPEGF
jgi:transposase